MSNAVFYCSFNLNEGVSVPDFLIAAEKLNKEYISKQNGYISWKQLVDGELWVDLVTFETMEDVKNFAESSFNPNEFSEKYFSLVNLNSCTEHFFTVERSY